jgi:catechol 2,3-dioxygenase-like lactoylglutathione lyase family enzyme
MAEGFPHNIFAHHVGIYVSDIDRSLKWYEEMLGFKLMMKKDFPLGKSGLTTMAWAKNGNFYLEFYHSPDKTPFSMESYQSTLGTKHVSFYLKNADFEPFKAYLRSKNITFRVEKRWTQEQTVKPGGCGVIYISDPDGLPIEIQEEFTPGEY